MDEKQFHLFVSALVIAALFLIGILMIVGLFGFWRRHNRQNSASGKPDAEGTQAKPDPWEVAGKRLNVDEDERK